MENEATQNDEAFNDLITTLKHLEDNRDRIMQDDDSFKGFLIESVFEDKLTASRALYLYCSKHGIDQFNVVDIRMKNGGPRTPILDLFDAVLVGQDISTLLNSIDIVQGQ